MDVDWDIDKVDPPRDKPRGLLVWMNLWYWWNKKGFIKADAVYRVEEIPERWCWFRHILGVGGYPYPEISRTINRKKTRRVLSWNELYEADADLTIRILELAQYFGYEQIPVDYLDDQFYTFPEHIELSEVTV